MDVDVATPASRGFFGVQFRIADNGTDAEWVYLRQHKSGLPDAMQYTPVLNTGLNWQIYNGPGFTAAVEILRESWFHIRLEVAGAQARFFVNDMDKPALVITDLKSDVQKGRVALAVLTGETCFSNFQVRETPASPWERRLPPMPEGILMKWSLSPSFDALARNLERPLSAEERAATPWQDVEAAPPGYVLINRYRDSPHPRVTFANDFSRRLEPEPGMKVVYARTSIESDRHQVKRAPDRLQRRRQHLPERRDPLPWSQCPVLPRPRIPRHRQRRERHRLPSAEEGPQRADARRERARRRVGIHLPPRRSGEIDSLAYGER